MDAAGNLVQVTEPNPVTSGQTYETYYTYDTLNRLTGVSMPRPNAFGGNYTQTRSWVYSGALLQSTTNPENGTVSYTYNFDGSLQRVTDAKGIKTDYTYDAYRRVTRVTKTDAANVLLGCETVEFTYDQSQDGWGRVTTVKWGNSAMPPETTGRPNQPSAGPCAKGLHTEEYHYNSVGKVTSKKIMVTRRYPDNTALPEPRELSSSLMMTYTYDSFGRAATVKYPDLEVGMENGWVTVTGTVYTNSYDTMGRLNGMTSPTGSVTGVSYNYASQMTAMSWNMPGGNFGSETRQYNAYGQLTQLNAGSFVETYNYSATQNDGRVTSIARSGEEVVYQYDALQRLVRAETVGAGGWGMSCTYDGWGNRTSQGVVKGTVPVNSVSVDPATNRMQGWTYDANGNVTWTSETSWITYDASNRIHSMQFPVAESYEYDPSNKRIWKTTSSGETFTFWGGRGERIGRYAPEVQVRTIDGVATHKFVWVKQGLEDVYFGGKRLQATDRLGSVGGGGRYYPYGEERSATAEGTDKFATYHRDATGFDYADQRYYSSKFGRFLTSDPFKPSATKAVPITWNRYSYVNGDPVNFSDPRGLIAISFGGSGICSVGSGEGAELTSCDYWTISYDMPQPSTSRGEERIVINTNRPLGRRAEERLRRAFDGLKDALRNPSERCQKQVIDKLDAAFGKDDKFSMSSFLGYLDRGATFWNGATSATPLAGNVTTPTAASSLAAALHTGSNPTVSGVFSQSAVNGVTTITSITATSLTVWFGPSTVSGSNSANMALLFHEALHGFGGTVGGTSYFDADIQAAFGIDVGKASENITKYIRENCF